MGMPLRSVRSIVGLILLTASAASAQQDRHPARFKPDQAGLSVALRREWPTVSTVMAMTFDPIGSTVICGSSQRNGDFPAGPGRVVFCDLTPPAGEPLTIDAYSSQVNILAINPAGSLLISGGDGGSLTFWNLKERTKLFEHVPPKGEVYPPYLQVRSISFDPKDPNQVAVLAPKNQLERWDVARRKIVRKEDLTGVQFDPIGTNILSISHGKDHGLKILAMDMEPHRPIRPEKLDVFDYYLKSRDLARRTNDWRTLVAGGDCPWVSQADVSRSIACLSDVPAIPPADVEWSRIDVVDAATGEHQGSFATPKASSCQLSPDGRVLAVAVASISPKGRLVDVREDQLIARPEVYLFDVRASRRLGVLPGPGRYDYPPTLCAFDPTGNLLAVGGYEGVRVWDLAGLNAAVNARN